MPPDVGADQHAGGAPKRYRVLAVVPCGDGAASMPFAYRQIDALRARGHTVEVFELRSRTCPDRILADLRQYRAILRTFRPDVVHAHYGTVTGFFATYGAIGRAPAVVMYRGSDLNPVPSTGRIRVAAAHVLSQLAALAAHGLICVSAELRDRLWWRRNLVTLVPTGVDTTRFFPISRAEARARLGWTHERPALLFNAGGRPAVKRLDLAEAAAAVTRRFVPDLEFVVLAGKTPPDRVPDFMNASDCVLLTSDYEGSPTIIQEAMACNVPVISVAAGDAPERLALVQPSGVVERDPELLGQAVARVLLERSRSNGYEIALRELAPAPICRLVEQAYELAVSRYKR